VPEFRVPDFMGVPDRAWATLVSLRDAVAATCHESKPDAVTVLMPTGRLKDLPLDDYDFLVARGWVDANPDNTVAVNATGRYWAERWQKTNRVVLGWA